MLDAISVVVSIFLLIGAGMLLTRIKWIDQAGAKLLARLTVNVGLGALVLSNMMGEFTREKLIESAGGIAGTYLSILLTVAAGFLCARLFGIDGKRRGVFVSMFSFSNSVFIGVPVAVALFGSAAMPYALIYYIANTSLFWSIGNFLMARDGGQGGSLGLKKLLPVPLLAFLLSAGLVLIGVKLPSFVMRTAGYLGALVTPLSLIYTGYVIMNMISRGALKWNKGYAPMLIGRYLIGPGLLLLTSFILPVPGLMRPVLFIQSAMPVMTQTTIAAGDRGADVEYAAGGLLVSTILSIAIIPLYMGLTQFL